jgi:hypothetical protein
MLTYLPSSSDIGITRSRRSELACFIAAWPVQCRVDMLKAVLHLESSVDVGAGYSVDFCRVELYRCLVEQLGATSNMKDGRCLDLQAVERRLTQFSTATDLVQVNLVLCGLLDCLVESLKAASRQSFPVSGQQGALFT